MIEIGKYNKLKVVRIMSIGMYLADESGEEVLLPTQYMPANLKLHDEVEVFVYKDGEHRIVATTMKPAFTLHEFAALQVNNVTEHGAFMEWGLDKDLFVPFMEQAKTMQVDKWYVVYLYLDVTSQRLVGSSRVNKFVGKEKINLKIGEEVDLLAFERTDLGFNVIVNNKFKGLVYSNEVFREVQFGEKMKGYVKKIREDDKVDITLQPIGFARIDESEELILKKMSENNGFLPVHDKSEPDEIIALLKMSKKTFKKAVGSLYKQKRIRLEEDGIYLV